MSAPAPTHDSLRARAERLVSPGYGYCFRCGRPWSRVKGHDTQYTSRRACFPLCEDCWTTLGSPEARIGYYSTLIDWWASLGCAPTDDERAAIGRAVAGEPVTA